MAKKRNTARHLTKERSKRRRNQVNRTGSKQKLKIQLQVSQTDWGNIQPNEIAVLLQDTAFHINRLLRVPFDVWPNDGVSIQRFQSAPITQYR